LAGIVSLLSLVDSLTTRWSVDLSLVV